jgi:hypothetical protein
LGEGGRKSQLKEEESFRVRRRTGHGEEEKSPDEGGGRLQMK